MRSVPSSIAPPAGSEEKSLARLVIAIELFRAEQSRLPTTVVELVEQGLIDRLPVDPVSGRPFGYRVLDDLDDPRGYIVYSLGPSGIDNAGAQLESKPTDAAWNSDVSEQYDYVINQLPRDE